MILDDENGCTISIYVNPEELNGYDTRDLVQILSTALTATSSMSNKNSAAKEIIQLFENHLSGSYESKQRLHQTIHPTNNTQYKKGL